MIMKWFKSNYVIYTNILHSSMFGIHRRNERTGYEKILFEKHKNRVNNAHTVLDTYQYTKIKPIPKYKFENQIQRKKIYLENADLLTRLAKVRAATHTHHHISVIRQLQLKKHLTRVKRTTELRRIQKGNVELLNAIQKVKPSICIEAFEKDFEKSRKIMKTMSLYPEYIK